MELFPAKYSPESLWLQGMNKVNEYKGHQTGEAVAKVAARVMALALPAVASVGVFYHLAGALTKAALMAAPKSMVEKYNLQRVMDGADFKTAGLQFAAFNATKIATVVLAIIGAFSPEKAIAIAESTGLYKTGMSQGNVDRIVTEMKESALQWAKGLVKQAIA